MCSILSLCTRSLVSIAYDPNKTNGNTTNPPIYPRQEIKQLWDLTPDDLRWSWCNNNRNKLHNKCNVLESSRNHPSLSLLHRPHPTPPLPPAPIHGKIVFHGTGSWFKMVGDHWLRIVICSLFLSLLNFLNERELNCCGPKSPVRKTNYKNKIMILALGID